MRSVQVDLYRDDSGRRRQILPRQELLSPLHLLRPCGIQHSSLCILIRGIPALIGWLPSTRMQEHAGSVLVWLHTCSSLVQLSFDLSYLIQNELRNDSFPGTGQVCLGHGPAFEALDEFEFPMYRLPCQGRRYRCDRYNPRGISISFTARTLLTLDRHTIRIHRKTHRPTKSKKVLTYAWPGSVLERYRAVSVEPSNKDCRSPAPVLARPSGAVTAVGVLQS